MNTSLDDAGAMNHLFKLELGFYEVLVGIAKRTKVFFTIPETFIQGFGFPQLTLLCTDYETGEFLVRDDVTPHGLNDALSFFEDLNKIKGKDVPIAVHKLAASTYCRDTCRTVITTQEGISLWNSHQAQGHSQLLQRYICSLNQRPAVIRAIWEKGRISKTLFTLAPPSKSRRSQSGDTKIVVPKKDPAPPKKAYILSTKGENVVKTELFVAHTIDSKMLYMITLLEKYYLPSPDLKIHSLEVDFAQDGKGLCYMINMRSFKLSKHLGYEVTPVPRALSRFKKRQFSHGSFKSMEEPRLSLPKITRIPKIQRWPKALQSHQQVLAAQEEKERAKLSKTTIMME